LTFYSGSSVSRAAVWIISRLRNRRKNDAAPTPELFFSWTWLQIRSSCFHWCGLGSGSVVLFSWLRLQLRLLFVFTH